eukprot:Nitzschia sp. Nitz4//scaffold145_size56662//44435//46408//NITZ4_006564-RA/size56662-processed-gene-0.20-mRNA-1//1//CDS//3329536598//8472//frame0
MTLDATPAEELLHHSDSPFQEESANHVQLTETGPSSLLDESASQASSSFLSAFRWTPTALAFSSTTPWIARIFLPTLCLATHVLFYYGQTAPMWKLHLFSDIDVFANATDTAACGAFDVMGLNYNQHYTHADDRDVQTFTYYYAIHHLWAAKGIPGKVLPRLGAVLLILFSGIWPHVKLFLLHVTWFFGKQAQQRTNTLQWLGTLGKWSLADVLVICVMVGVLNLDWVVDPEAIKQGIIADLPSLIQLVHSQYDETQLCDKLLKTSCESAKKASTRTKCKACTALVATAYDKPEWANSSGATILKGIQTSGGGSATLRVVGMSGIYAFCGAVILSILLSLMVDIFDHRAQQELRRQQRWEMAEQQLEASNRENTQEGDGLEEPLLGGATPLEMDLGLEERTTSSRRAYRRSLFSTVFGALAMGVTILVLFAVDSNTMERRVFGAGPQMLHDILGVDWERPYSLTSLMWTTGAHGRWDFMLMATFGLFCVLGPVFRGVMLVVAALLDGCHMDAEPIANMINFIGAFCSWEVFAVAIVMVQMLMPSITNTIIRNKACEAISDDGSCLQVEFNILPKAFGTIVAGGVLLILFSYGAILRWTDRVATSIWRGSPVHGTATFFANHHDYERLPSNGQSAAGGNPLLSGDDELEELVFETNQV